MEIPPLDDDFNLDENLNLNKFNLLSDSDKEILKIMPEIIILISDDQDEYEVKREEAINSEVLKGHFRFYQNDGSINFRIDNLGVNSRTLKYIITYMRNHPYKEKFCQINAPLASVNMQDVCDNYDDVVFINEIAKERQLLYDILRVAEYLEIKSLVYLGCAKVASLIKGKNLDEIKTILSSDEL